MTIDDYRNLRDVTSDLMDKIEADLCVMANRYTKAKKEGDELEMIALSGAISNLSRSRLAYLHTISFAFDKIANLNRRQRASAQESSKPDQ